MFAHCAQAQDTSKKLAQTKSLQHAQTAKGGILLPVKNAQHSLPKKRALGIQAESHCTISVAREQAGHDASTEEAAKSYARVVAHSQADLINRNLTLSEENARLREVIGTLRQDNASLQQRLDSYEQRLQTLEQSMLGGVHPDTPLVGVQKKHICRKFPQCHPCGHLPQTLEAQLVHVPACLEPKPTGLRVLGMPHHTSQISPQLHTRRWNWEGRDQPLSQLHHQWQSQQERTLPQVGSDWLSSPSSRRPGHSGWCPYHYPFCLHPRQQPLHHQRSVASNQEH